MTMTNELIAQHGLTSDEYQRIVEALGREPTLTELGIFSVMWSEHCSYKSSRIHLRKLPTQGPRVLQGPGENAGAVDIGDGLVMLQSAVQWFTRATPATVGVRGASLNA